MKNPQVDLFFEKKEKWQIFFQFLREIVLDTGLKEELKWGCPCYTNNGKNIVLIHGFKDYCAMLFMQGALLKDPKKILIQQSKNVQAARQIRFIHVEEVKALEDTIKKYIREAIKNDSIGLKVEHKSTAAYELPQELQSYLDEMPVLHNAFYNLTPGRQRAYLLYFSSAKQSKTRLARIEKCIDKILAGKGLDD